MRVLVATTCLTLVLATMATPATADFPSDAEIIALVEESIGGCEQFHGAGAGHVTMWYTNAHDGYPAAGKWLDGCGGKYRDDEVSGGPEASYDAGSATGSLLFKASPIDLGGPDGQDYDPTKKGEFEIREWRRNHGEIGLECVVIDNQTGKAWTDDEGYVVPEYEVKEETWPPWTGPWEIEVSVGFGCGSMEGENDPGTEAGDWFTGTLSATECYEWGGGWVSCDDQG